jgi:hypothetical protein
MASCLQQPLTFVQITALASGVCKPSACVCSQQLGKGPVVIRSTGATQREALHKPRWSATKPGHLLAHTRPGCAVFVWMTLRSVRLYSGLPARQMATGLLRHRYRGRSTSPAAVARLSGQTGRRSQSGTPWRDMLAGSRVEIVRASPRTLACERPSNQVSNNRHRQWWTPMDSHGRSIAAQACSDADSPRQYLASGRRGQVGGD